MRGFLKPWMLAIVLAVGHVHASFHLWTMTELYSNADASVQYLELQTPFGGQQFLSGHSLTSTSGSTTHTFQFTDLPGDTTGKTMLVGTESFAAAWGIAPDFVVPDGFFFPGGGSINFAGVDPWNHGALPGGTLSLNRNGSTGPGSPQNFAGQTGSSGADLVLTQSASPNPVGSGKDVMFTMTGSNGGPLDADGVLITAAYDSSATVVWASPECFKQGALAIYECGMSSLAPGASAQFKLVLRKSAAGSVFNNASIAATTSDPDSANNAVDLTVPVTATPAGAAVLRYRLYSDGTKEHLFTTDLNEYNVLGASGGWAQEGTVGRVLDNPGVFNGVTAVPYYRLYYSGTAWHHWTTDANEYYTLITYPGWNGEGVDGYILPTGPAGATQLYRLVYPHVAGLHHWTIDANEYNALIGTHGWIGEGGAGFVIQ